MRIASRTASRLALDSFGFDAMYSRTDATRFLDCLAMLISLHWRPEHDATIVRPGKSVTDAHPEMVNRDGRAPLVVLIASVAFFIGRQSSQPLEAPDCRFGPRA